MCIAVEKGIGQPCGLKFLIEEGCAPSCRDRVSASSPVKSGAGIFCKKGQKIFRSRAKRRVLTGCGRSDSSCCAGTGRGTGFSSPNKERQLREGRKRLCGGSKGQQIGQFITIQPVSTVLQAPARRSCDVLDCLALPLGRDKEGSLSALEDQPFTICQILISFWCCLFYGRLPRIAHNANRNEDM